MPPPNRMTPEPMIAILRDCADRNGGWLSTADYTRLSPKGAPTYPLVGRILGAATWDEVCKAAGISRTPFDSLPDILSESQIRFVLTKVKRGGIMTPLRYRQQVAVYCLRVVAQQLKRTKFTALVYDEVADESLYSSRSVADAFGNWSDAVAAAGLGCGWGNWRDEERQSSMMLEVAGNAHPANWRTQDVTLHTLTPVTKVTVFRTLTPGIGLRHTEVRACIR